MRHLFVIDPLPGLAADIDASVGLMDAAQALGHEVWCCGPEDIALVEHRVQARARRVQLRPRRRPIDGCRWEIDSPWFDEREVAALDVAADCCLVHLRIDPPVDARFLHTTYLLDLVGNLGGCVVNRPSGVRAVHEKVLALHYPDLCPATLVSTDVGQLRGFVEKVGSAVIKPVDGFGGTGVWLVHDDQAALSLLESATHGGTRHVIGQEYLSGVEHGNKRLFVVDGYIAGAVLRHPVPGDFRIAHPTAPAEMTDADEAIVARLRPELVRHGIAIAGLDVIDGRLIEVNVTCPGGMHKTDALLGTDLSGRIVRRLLSTISLVEGIPA